MVVDVEMRLGPSAGPCLLISPWLEERRLRWSLQMVPRLAKSIEANSSILAFGVYGSFAYHRRLPC